MADESRIENILDATLGEPGAEVPSPPFSRIEEKLIELKEAIESGGGGGGTTNYNDLSNKPSINGHTLQGNSTLDGLGAASKTTLDAAIEELELMETEIDSKADLSIFTPMTQEQYDALVTKTAPLYFIYEDGESS